MNQAQRKFLFEYREQLETRLREERERGETQAVHRLDVQLSTFEVIERGLGENLRPGGKEAGAIEPPPESPGVKVWKLRTEVLNPEGVLVCLEKALSDLEVRANPYAVVYGLSNMADQVGSRVRVDLAEQP